MAVALAPVNPQALDDLLAGTRCPRHVAQMTAKDKEREERLAAALRENLKRRKARLRALDRPQQDGEDG